MKQESAIQSRRAIRAGAFTLVELLVVIAIIVLLISLLMPALAGTREQARRVICRSHLSQIHIGSLTYATSNQGALITARGRGVQLSFDPAGNHVHRARPHDREVDWIKQLASVGLAAGNETDIDGNGYMHHEPAPFWDCPSRNYRSRWEMQWPAVIIAYQYFGGIETWTNPEYSGPSRSPINARSSSPEWVLAADATLKIDGVWGGGRATAYQDLPSHKDGGYSWPEGGNQVYVDGSVEWIPFEEMTFIHTWGGINRIAYFKQKDLGDYAPSPAMEASR